MHDTNFKIFGYAWEDIKSMQQGTYKRPTIKKHVGDYGCDPLGDGMYRMFPSGDIVNTEERKRRLGH